MTANELHLMTTRASIETVERAVSALKAAEEIFAKTEPARRDSSGENVSQLSLQIYQCAGQASQASAMLVELLSRTRERQIKGAALNKP